MTLPRRIPKPEKRTGRWKSQSHCTFLRKFACCACDSITAIEVSHIRIGTDGGMGRKPSDFYAIPLCKNCHSTLHTRGEAEFYRANNLDALALAEEFAKASPKAMEIRNERANRG